MRCSHARRPKLNSFFTDAWARLLSSDAIIAAVITVLIPVLFAAVNGWISPKPRLKYGIWSSIVLLPKASNGLDSSVYVQQIALQNWGRKAAEEVEIIWNWKPPHIEQYPHLASHEEIKPDGRYVARIPRLNGKEGVTFSLLSEGAALPAVIYVRGKDTSAKLIEFRTNFWLPLWGRVAFFALLFLGIFSVVYLSVLLLAFLFFGRIPNL